jgi:uncharacterized membrane protein YphA (DoxX/SURF4 family)
MRSTILRKSDRNAVASVRVNDEPRAATGTDDRDRRKGSVRLWIAQGLLAALFLFAGGMKLVMPLDLLAQQSHLPGLFMRFIAVCETLGALGLILPGLLRIRPGLTPLAAVGLAIIMIGATVTTLMRGEVAPALLPFVVGLLSTFVAHGRWRLALHREVSHHSVLQPAS